MTYQLGTSIESLQSLSSLGIPNPRGSFQEGAERKVLGDFSVIWVGLPRASWSWGFITRPQREILRGICPDPSKGVVFRSTVNDNYDEFRLFSGTMIWPDEQKDFTRRIDFILQFVGLEFLEEEYGSS